MTLANFARSAVDEAHRAPESGAAAGKIVVDIRA
jgi:hypothetical protein